MTSYRRAAALLLTALLLQPVTVLAAPPAMQGRAAPAAIVERDGVRFTVLTPRLIRMEYAPNGKFVDAPSQVFVDRRQEVPQFSVTTRDGQIFIETASLSLSYILGSGAFNARNLEIRSKALQPAFSWHPGDSEQGNLGGTVRTLDRYDGAVNIDSGLSLDLGQGLLSRGGWHLIDDSASYLFDEAKWAWVKPRDCAECQDLYFLGFGHQYTQALTDFIKVAGREPMPPRFAFGYWWSRYWNYSDSEMRDLVAKFEQYGVPLDVLVFDMDWHRTDGLSWDPAQMKKDEVGEPVGWTGFTWNESLFPDPERMLDWLHSRRLRTTLNLHLASGIPTTEEKYSAFAAAMDAPRGRDIRIDTANKPFMANLFNLVLGPLEAKGVDFWWLDWQQWPNSTTLTGLSNTWWLNYAFFTNMQRKGRNRALIYHRWGGLGNHRYQVGFSGDTVISWASLAFQPYFTSTASNVLYGYWSHDVGGHMFRDGTTEANRHIDPELYVRWMQFGGYSPILRTHSSKEAALRKEPWRFSPEVSSALQAVVKERYAMAPYIYTAARQAYDVGISLLRPLYYYWPEQAEAYEAKSEYMFGDDMLVAPIAKPMENGVATQSIWLPPGRWYDRNRGEVVEGGRTFVRDYALDEVPVFVRAGAVIPMNPPSVTNLGDMDSGALILRMYPGGRSSSRLYADAGDSEGYRAGEHTFTTVHANWHGDRATLRMEPREGRYPGMRTSRQVKVELENAAVPVEVRVNGVIYSRSDNVRERSWRYDGEALRLCIDVPPLPAARAVSVDIRFGEAPVDLSGLRYRMKRVAAAVEWLKDHWNSPGPLPDEVSLASQLGRIIDYRPEDLPDFVARFNTQLGTLVTAVDASSADAAVKTRFRKAIDSVR